MIEKRKLYRVRCNNVGCKNGKDMSPMIYENTVEMKYRAFQEHIVEIGWVFCGELTFCPTCAANRRGVVLMKR